MAVENVLLLLLSISPYLSCHLVFTSKSNSCTELCGLLVKISIINLFYVRVVSWLKNHEHIQTSSFAAIPVWAENSPLSIYICVCIWAMQEVQSQWYFLLARFGAGRYSVTLSYFPEILSRKCFPYQKGLTFFLKQGTEDTVEAAKHCELLLNECHGWPCRNKDCCSVCSGTAPFVITPRSHFHRHSLLGC